MLIRRACLMIDNRDMADLLYRTYIDCIHASILQAIRDSRFLSYSLVITNPIKLENMTCAPWSGLFCTNCRKYRVRGYYIRYSYHESIDSIHRSTLGLCHTCIMS